MFETSVAIALVDECAAFMLWRAAVYCAWDRLCCVWRPGLAVCCATTRMLLESAKRAFLSKGVARLAKRGDRGKLTNIEQHKDKQPQPRPIEYDPKKTTSCASFYSYHIIID